MDQKYHVVVGLPTYDGTRENGIPLARLLKHYNPEVIVNLIELKTSALAFGFNIIWANMLNLRSHPTHPPTHFLLWHADVLPQGDTWLDTMLSEMERVGADVLSAVIPIKNEQGMTSTARETDDPWRPLRYTTTEISVMRENTFTEPGILLNTGLMLVDFRKPWVEEVCFTMHDRIAKGADGKFKASFQPEDWDFSRQCRAKGLNLYATKAFPVVHMGKTAFRSDQVWGFATDEEFRRQTKDQ